MDTNWTIGVSGPWSRSYGGFDLVVWSEYVHGVETYFYSVSKGGSVFTEACSDLADGKTKAEAVVDSEVW